MVGVIGIFQGDPKRDNGQEGHGQIGDAAGPQNQTRLAIHRLCSGASVGCVASQVAMAATTTLRGKMKIQELRLVCGNATIGLPVTTTQLLGTRVHLNT